MGTPSIDCDLELVDGRVRLVIRRSGRYDEAPLLRSTTQPDGRQHLVCDRRIHTPLTRVEGWVVSGAVVTELLSVHPAGPACVPLDEHPAAG